MHMIYLRVGFLWFCLVRYSLLFLNLEICLFGGVVCVCAQSHKSCLTLCNLMDCRPPGSSLCGISQARILEWAAISFSRGCSWPWNWTHISCIAGGFFTTEPPGKTLEELVVILIFFFSIDILHFSFWNSKDKSTIIVYIISVVTEALFTCCLFFSLSFSVDISGAVSWSSLFSLLLLLCYWALSVWTLLQRLCFPVLKLSFVSLL